MFTPERREIILRAVRSGMPQKHAAALAGVTEATLARWLARGRAAEPGDEEFVEFYEEMQKARAAFVLANLAHISQAAQAGTWQAAAWLLERSYPGDFGRTRVEVTGPGGGPIQHQHEVQGRLEFVALAPEDIQAIDAVWREAGVLPEDAPALPLPDASDNAEDAGDE